MGKKDFNRIIRETISRCLSNYVKENVEYKLQSVDELYGYMWLKPNITNIDVDMFVDDGGAYIRDEHVPLLFIRNGRGRYVSEFIPVSISQTPEILDNSIDIVISNEVISQVFDFIRINFSILIEMSNGNLNADKFVSSLITPTLMRKGECLIKEMSTLKKSESNLPMDIWIDEGGCYMGYAPRIKFRASKEQRYTRDFSSMLLTNPPTIENLPHNSDIRTKDIEMLKQFVIANLDLLLKLANGEIDYRTQFLPNMKKPQ